MKALVIANWKMNPHAFAEAKKLVAATKKALAHAPGVTLVIAPPALYLRDLASGQRAGRVSFAAQNVHFLDGGSYTGDISPIQVRDAKATHVIVGHAERRLLGETNEDVRKKVAAVIASQMMPIICVGESKREPNGEHLHFIRSQIESAYADVIPTKLAKTVIAYEPVWAIGATKAMQPRDMHEMSIFIRKTLVEKYGDSAYSVPVLYGGAVDAGNAAGMMRDGDVKGLLVGRASTDAKIFSTLLREISRA